MNPLSPRTYSGLPVGCDTEARRRRICIASFDFVGPVKNGGVGTAFTSLGEALASAGHEVTLLFLGGNWCENLTLEHWIRHYRSKGIRFVPMPESGLKINSRWHINKAYEAYLWLKAERFDIIHFSEWKAPGYFTLRAKQQGMGFGGTLLCVHTHGPTLWHKLSNGEYVTSVDDIELDYLERQSVQLADVVVSPSQYLLRWMGDRGWVLPANSFVQQYVRPATARDPKPDADRLHQVTELVFFGRLEVRKGLVLFCDALDLLAEDRTVRHLAISFLGKPDLVQGRNSADYLSSRAKNWPWQMQVISGRDQVGAMDYLQVDGRLAVIPSLVDNLPNTVLECLGAKVPFVASNAGGIPEMIAHEDLETAMFPLKAAALADKLRQTARAGVHPPRYAIDQKENESAWVRWHEGLSVGPEPLDSGQAATAERQPLVSVCISHWNRPAYLRQALHSIEMQDYRHIEVVLVDDGSNLPHAKQVIAELQHLFEARGWQLLRNAENRYPGAARNRAARHARGEYLMFMDDDNYAKPHEVSTFLAVAQRTGAEIVTCCLDTFAGEDAPSQQTKPTSRWLFLGDDIATGAFRNNFGDTNSLWKKEAFLSVGGFHEDWGVGHEDWELFAKATIAGRRLVTVPEPLAWYRLNADEATVNRKTSLHANHQANIRPYLETITPELRNLVLYAQGASMRLNQPMVDEVTLKQLVELTSLWRSKLEAALVLIELRQPAAATKMMVEAVKSVEHCKNPKIIIEAILGVTPHLASLDSRRARFLLDLAAKSAQRIGWTKERDAAQELMAKLPGGAASAMRMGAMASLQHSVR